MSVASSHLYPLLMQRRLVHRLWGGNWIAEWLKLSENEMRPATLGETWEVFDTNIIRNGDLAGQTLTDVTCQYGVELVGTRTAERYGVDFPLLAKFIDSRDKLSIQVHPDDAYAHTYEAATGFHGKTEAWYILRTVPGANIFYGVNHTVSRETFETMVREGKLEDVLKRVPVSAGDVIFMPSGTLHAINEGVLLFEIQEKSDLTYRVYDYGRKDPATGQQRALHLEKALDVARLTPSPKLKNNPLSMEKGDTRMLLAACSHFALERLIVVEERAMVTDPGTLEIVTVVDGQGILAWSNGSVVIRTGDSVVIPATLGNWVLRPIPPIFRVLRAYVPDIERDIIEPVRRRGVSYERLLQVIDVV